MARAGEVVTVDTANDVFGPPGMTAGNFRTVIVRLRRKLAEAGFPDVSIASVRGSGYVWNESVEIHID
jgi:DNA-binding response OmpR family regulator